MPPKKRVKTSNVAKTKEEIFNTDENKCPSTKNKIPIEEKVETETEVEKFDLNEITDFRKFVNEQNQLEMPDDFYDFLDFCKSIDHQDPKSKVCFFIPL
jgi:hypothetical protein